MAGRRNKPKCYVLRHEGNDGNEQMSTMKWTRHRQLGLPLKKSWACRGEHNGKVSRQKASGLGSGSRSRSQTAMGAGADSVMRTVRSGTRIQDLIQSRLYYHVVPVSTSSSVAEGCGAVFNLEFSPLG